MLQILRRIEEGTKSQERRAMGSTIPRRVRRGTSRGVVTLMLGIRLNHIFSAMPLGTLAANLIGRYLIAVAIAHFSYNSTVPVRGPLLMIRHFDAMAGFGRHTVA